jgi:GT2 family glycosyltransferase
MVRIGMIWSKLEKKNTPVLSVIRLSQNIGFGPANNMGVGSTTSPFVALVNSDAFVFPGALQTLRDYLLANPKVGVVGPRLLNVDGSMQESRFSFPNPVRAWAENLGLATIMKWINRDGLLSQGPVEWLSGACLMFRREVWERVGGFDESETMRLGWEDREFFLRCLKAGYVSEVGDDICLLWRRHANTMSNEANKHANTLQEYIYNKNN